MKTEPSIQMQFENGCVLVVSLWRLDGLFDSFKAVIKINTAV